MVKNIRRGNTLIIKQEPNKEQIVFIGRKGLMKFFDLHFDFVSKDFRYDLSLSTPSEILHQEKNYILAPVLKSIACGDDVLVYNTLKANGENV